MLKFSKYQLHTHLKSVLQSRGQADIYEYLEYGIDNSVFYQGPVFKISRSSQKISFVKNILRQVLLRMFAPRDNASNVSGAASLRGLSQTSYCYDERIECPETQIARVFWAPKLKAKIWGELDLLIRYWRIKYTLLFKYGEHLICPDFISEIVRFRTLVSERISKSNFQFLLVSEDMTFESRLLIDVFKEKGKPTFLLSHGGIHSFYGRGMDNKTHFVGQWSEVQVSGFVKAGYDPDRFFVTGHPLYTSFPKKLKFSLESVLVLTKSIQGTSLLSSIHSEDRGRAITYMLLVKSILQSLGVERVRFRPHPSENPQWYSKFFDGFYIQDTDPLAASLEKATLVIGPLSTTIIDSLSSGVNYCLFDPVSDGVNIFEGNIASALEGFGELFPWTSTPEELRSVLINKKSVDIDFAFKLCNPGFDFEEVRRRIISAVNVGLDTSSQV